MITFARCCTHPPPFPTILNYVVETPVNIIFFWQILFLIRIKEQILRVCYHLSNKRPYMLFHDSWSWWLLWTSIKKKEKKKNRLNISSLDINACGTYDGIRTLVSHFLIHPQILHFPKISTWIHHYSIFLTFIIFCSRLNMPMI